MWRGWRIAVVVPAYCEARLIGRTLASMPGYVDAIYAVDDGSPDGTAEAIAGFGRSARAAHPA